MSNYIVRASLLALLATQSTAITLKTLLENQISAGTSTQASTSLRLEEAAVNHVARDIQQLAQVAQDDIEGEVHDEVEEGYIEIAKMLVDMTRDGKFETLKAAMIDVQNGTYQVSKEAQMAVGTLDDGSLSQADILVRQEQLIDQNTTLTNAVDGSPIPFVVQQAADPVAQVAINPVVVESTVQQQDVVNLEVVGDEIVNESADQGDADAAADQGDQGDADASAQTDPVSDGVNDEQNDDEQLEDDPEVQPVVQEQTVQVGDDVDAETEVDGVDPNAPDDESGWLSGWI